jgi:hypothetical protein
VEGDLARSFTLASPASLDRPLVDQLERICGLHAGSGFDW